MQPLITLFLSAFLLDGVVTLTNEFVEMPLFRLAIAWPVLMVAMVLYVAMAFLPRLPKDLLLPPALFLMWTWVAGGFPLPFFVPGEARQIMAILQIGLGGILLMRAVMRGPIELTPAGFSWRNFALTLAGTMALAPVLAAVGVVQHAGTFIERQTSGYVKLRPTGLLFEERHFQRGEKQVRLVSMIHIGEPAFYESVYDSYPHLGPAVVLMEGVSDQDNLLSNQFSYAKIAEMVGLTPQESSSVADGPGELASAAPVITVASPSTVEYRRADVDIRVFQPSTIFFMNTVAAFLADPTSRETLREISDPSLPFNQPGAQEAVLADIVDKRNIHLVGELENALETHDTVIIPWGALHLPFVESTLLRWGFRETGRLDRPAIRLMGRN